MSNLRIAQQNQQSIERYLREQEVKVAEAQVEEVALTEIPQEVAERLRRAPDNLITLGFIDDARGDIAGIREQKQTELTVSHTLFEGARAIGIIDALVAQRTPGGRDDRASLTRAGSLLRYLAQNLRALKERDVAGTSVSGLIQMTERLRYSIRAMDEARADRRAAGAARLERDLSRAVHDLGTSLDQFVSTWANRKKIDAEAFRMQARSDVGYGFEIVTIPRGPTFIAIDERRGSFDDIAKRASEQARRSNPDAEIVLLHRISPSDEVLRTLRMIPNVLGAALFTFPDDGTRILEVLVDPDHRGAGSEAVSAWSRLWNVPGHGAQLSTYEDAGIFEHVCNRWRRTRASEL